MMVAASITKTITMPFEDWLNLIAILQAISKVSGDRQGYGDDDAASIAPVARRCLQLVQEAE
jgi:hypothetical protein